MTTQPVKINFSVWKGATFSKRLTIYTDNTLSTPKDLTGGSALLEIKDKPHGTILYTMNTANEQITLGGIFGTVFLKITDEDTSEFAWSSGIYDLFVTDVYGDTDAVLYGSFKVQSI